MTIEPQFFLIWWAQKKSRSKLEGQKVLVLNSDLQYNTDESSRSLFTIIFSIAEVDCTFSLFLHPHILKLRSTVCYLKHCLVGQKELAHSPLYNLLMFPKQPHLFFIKYTSNKKKLKSRQELCVINIRREHAFSVTWKI